ncbi:uncharacterized protein LOC142978868 [Anticarsia gemmatalis]|uniref:uncharacterized protein LOC142978868 n=1 Tax=Anticarsia gemmatalis TaxID=129554 RepID=UPI003F770A98
MATFEFNSEPSSMYNGLIFYQTYKDSDFLRVDSNVEIILNRGYMMRQEMKKTTPVGESMSIKGMQIGRNEPLRITNTGDGVVVEDLEFTYNRLVALVAAYAYENRDRFPAINAPDANLLGLKWDNTNEENCKLYLSAIYGTENMTDKFSYFPLICGIRKFQLKKMSAKLVVGIGKVKNSEGVTIAKLLKNNLVTAKRMWLKFPGAALREFQTLINETPEFKRMFQE